MDVKSQLMLDGSATGWVFGRPMVRRPCLGALAFARMLGARAALADTLTRRKQEGLSREMSPCDDIVVDCNRLAVNYRMRVDAPPAMPWQEYEQRLRSAWTEVLSGQPTELQVQTFFEKHPALVPGAHSAQGRMRSGHGPFPSALITQPALRGLTTRTPDFVWISCDSAFLNPVFIEIEAPGKRWLTAGGHQHHQLTQALHQLDEWREWFDQPANRQVFVETYDLPASLRRRKWEPIWLLIYGRRDEDAERVSKLRGRLTTATQIVIPYEHIEPDADASDYLCVRRGADRYHAVSVPPTVQLIWASVCQVGAPDRVGLAAVGEGVVGGPGRRARCRRCQSDDARVGYLRARFRAAGLRCLGASVTPLMGIAHS